MVHESILETPVYVGKTEVILPEAAAPAKPVEVQPPSEEQALATDEYFAQAGDSEAQAVATMIGLWTSTLLLHDLVVEHLRGPRKDEEEEPKRVPPRKNREE